MDGEYNMHGTDMKYIKKMVLENQKGNVATAGRTL
jgi:hypothetical protein